MGITSGFMKHNGINIHIDRKDYSEVVHTIDASSLNFYEYVHGGIYYSLADAAAGVSSRSDGNNYVTINSSFNYMKAVKKGVLKACATVVSRTTRLCVVNVNVLNEDEEIVSQGSFTMYRVTI